MINVNQITSYLAKLQPDSALQRYAQMHKGDPYILSLALAESNRRKETRQGAQMSVPPQPKVVDQEIQSMASVDPMGNYTGVTLPEDVGIGQLPAKNLAKMAEGGIVAFGSGGDVPRYNGSMGSFTATQAPVSVEELSRLYRLDPELAKDAALRAGPAGQRMFAQAVRLASTAGVPMAVGELGIAATGKAGADMANMTPEQRRGFYDNPMMGAMSPDSALAGAIMNAPGGTPSSTPYSTQMLKALTTPFRMLVSDPSLTAERDAQAAQRARDAKQKVDVQQAMDAGAFARPAAPPPGTGPGAQGAGPGQRIPPAGGPVAPRAGGPNINTPAPTAAAAAPMDVPAMMADALKKAENVQHPYAQELGYIGQARVKAKEEQVAGLEAIQKQFADIYKGRRERLDTKEAEVAKLKDQGLGLALLQAGAAMMTTPGAFGVALGKGVKVGTEQYAAGLDKLQAAKDKLSDARDRLEEIEAQRGELSARELLKARNEVKDTGISAREDMVKANMQMYGLKREEALKLVEQQVKVGTTREEIAGRKDVAQITAQSHLDAARIAAGSQLGLLRAVANDPKLAAIYSAKKTDPMQDYTNWLKANPQYMSDPSKALQAYLATQSVLGTTSTTGTAPTGGSVLPRKN